MIVVTVFLLVLNRMKFYLFQNRKENCHHDHIPLNLTGNGNIVFSVYPRCSQGGYISWEKEAYSYDGPSFLYFFSHEKFIYQYKHILIVTLPHPPTLIFMFHHHSFHRLKIFLSHHFFSYPKYVAQILPKGRILLRITINPK